MKILTIECSSATGSVAVTDDHRVLQSRSFENPRGSGLEFFAALEDEVSHCGDFDLVLVGTGPGGYNSLRSSIASAWGIARAKGVPVKGICSLLGYDSPEYYVIGDARAGQWFFAHYRSGALVHTIELLPPTEATQKLVTGIPVFSTSPLLESACVESPHAMYLATHSASAGEAVPIYLKPPHITKPNPKA